MTSATEVSFTGVSKRFDNGTLALDDVTFTVQPHEFVSVVGPSGCGKSTLLRLAARLGRPSEGRVYVATDSIGYIFQEATLLPWRTVLANVELLPELQGLPVQERRTRARDVLGVVGLTGVEKHLPGQLSGGMRMRVSLARALALEPELFLFDEPFGALDEITRLAMQEELQAIYAGRGFTSLFITHSVTEAVFLSSKVVVMSARPGRIAAIIDVPFDHPRSSELRFSPEFTAITHQVSSALLAGVS